MVHMKNKCGTLISKVALNGKRIIATCGIAVSICNLNCDCFKNLFNCGTNPKKEEKN